MQLYRLALMTLPLAAGLLAACHEARAPASGVGKTSSPAELRDQHSRSFHTVALDTEARLAPGLRDSADLVPDAPPGAESARSWGAGLRPGRGASGISP